jgi:hypothetical protein
VRLQETDSKQWSRRSPIEQAITESWGQAQARRAVAGSGK